MKKQLLHGATPASSSPSSFSPFLCFLLLLLFFLGSDSMGSREPWEAVLLRFSEPWDPTAVCTGPCFFPIERFLRLKEPQKWTIQYFSGWTVRSCPGFKTLSLNSLFISPDSRLPYDQLPPLINFSWPPMRGVFMCSISLRLTIKYHTLFSLWSEGMEWDFGWDGWVFTFNGSYFMGKVWMVVRLSFFFFFGWQ